ncbi:OmpW/AlkL family protein [Ciceribacter selenitireducens]|uniref:OmpW family protein n=1 Tax=Ciceribacter selenitireducens ATCC BAA-1503 TaxID=1336235 RepID=A0A376AHA5_9HYPH|nr:OmpW family protein [Ciceribacter selenitireducens]SSC67104.1 unnamed protein product [Ciceribacter selenitireducens ATCC BAA-1503]
MNTISTRRISALAAATALLLTGQVAYAADMTPLADAPFAAAQSPWQVRLRALGVISNNEGEVDGIAGSDLSYSDTVIPELDITYYFTDNIAAELILGTTYANVWGEGSITGLGKIGRTWILPPTLTLQYHFTDFGAFKPYVGAGLNYTIFYNEEGANADDLDIDNAFGVAVQAGFDYMIDQHWGVNFDVKKIFLEPDFTATVGGADVDGKAKLDPWLIGAGVTYRF